MKVAVLSDSHDNVWRLQEALPHLAGADAIIHCGDLCSPFMIHRLGEGAAGTPLHIVWGNNDGDKLTIARVAAAYPAIQLHGDLAELEIGGLRIAANHYPAIARRLAEAGEFDVVCYGHDHKRHEETVSGTLLLNPGELMGMNGRSTLAVFDTGNRAVSWVELS